MKKIVILISLFMIGAVCFAQNLVETVYLNNGSIIRGTIVEQTKDGVKIQTRDGNLFVYKMSEVLKITKEVVNHNNNVQSVNSNNGNTMVPTQNSFNYGGGTMERDRGGLKLNGRELDDREVLKLIGRETYEKTYLGAKTQYKKGNQMVVAGAILSAVGGAVLITGTILQYEVDNDFVYMAASGDAVFGVGFGVVLPVGLVLRSIGKGRLNWIAREYNSQSHRGNGYSLGINPCIKKQNFGGETAYAYGLTFKLSF